MSNSETGYQFHSEASKAICTRIFNHAANITQFSNPELSEQHQRDIKAARVELLEEHRQSMTCPTLLARSQRTIDNLRAQF